tara:strand:+ start:170 stop:391 length:222 start_codon:yes stop_codon:yes gene_type:complete
MKLKQLLEGYAWERRSDGSLPTLSDVTTIHEQSKESLKSLKMQGIEPEDPFQERIGNLEFRVKEIEKKLGIKY